MEPSMTASDWARKVDRREDEIEHWFRKIWLRPDTMVCICNNQCSRGWGKNNSKFEAITGYLYKTKNIQSAGYLCNHSAQLDCSSAFLARAVRTPKSSALDNISLSSWKPRPPLHHHSDPTQVSFLFMAATSHSDFSPAHGQLGKKSPSTAPLLPKQSDRRTQEQCVNVYYISHFRIIKIILC